MAAGLFRDWAFFDSSLWWLLQTAMQLAPSEQLQWRCTDVVQERVVEFSVGPVTKHEHVFPLQQLRCLAKANIPELPATSKQQNDAPQWPKKKKNTHHVSRLPARREWASVLLDVGWEGQA